MESSSKNACIADVRGQIEYYSDWHNETATDAQLKYIAAFDVPSATGFTKGQASELLDKLINDPVAQKRKEGHQERDRRELRDFPSFRMKREIEEAESNLEYLLKEEFEDGVEDAKEELEQATKARLTFWHDACSGENGSDEIKAYELYDQYGKYVKIPSKKVIQHVLDSLDAGYPNWDRTQEDSFWGTLQLNFPEMQRKRLA